ncbi:MAG: polysaccharide deacetylase family protein [Gammaproteobacteria bacterium]|nr:polysaccharide deacetylase family protein [Gammaproteobacteria bacterium]
MGKAVIQNLIAVLMAGILLPSQAAEHGVIVLYHHVADNTPPSTTISPAAFQSHLEFLRDNRFNVMALDDMIEALRNRQEIPDKSVAITFDDGYLSIYLEAFPMLQSFGFPFSVFLSTQPINDGQAGYMNWEQISEMANAGVLIANHMVEHPYMLDRIEGELQSEWIARLREEMLQAEQDIETHTGQQHRYLAYPYGEFNPTIKDMIASEGFTGLAQNSGAAGFNSDFLALPRYPLASIYANLDTASTKFSSLAFNVVEQIPDDPVTASDSPTVQVRFGPGGYSLDQIRCFANGRPLPMTWLDKDIGLLSLTPDQEFTSRRWRYICTAPLAGTGRFFWYSAQWIKPR